MDKLWDQLATQGPMVALMAIIIYFGGKYFATKEDAREVRYNAMVDKLVDIQTTTINSVTQVVAANTSVMQRVESKLNG